MNRSDEEENQLDYLHLTENPILLQKEYVLFGDWPQSIKKDDIIIEESNTYKINGWDCYKGNDGCFYVKETAMPDGDELSFSNEETIKKGDEYYFKLESIKWRVLENNFSGGKLLLSSKALVAHSYDNHIDEKRFEEKKRTFNGKTIHGNNYEYSEIRAYLNGLNGSSYDVKDFTDSGFINKAFSKKAIELIKRVTVDNSYNSTTDVGNNLEKNQIYVCNNTEDKVFLLSENEVTNQAFGVDAYDSYISDKTASSFRSIENTDYSLATGSFSSSEEEYENTTWWWLRTPYSKDSKGACFIGCDGDARVYDKISTIKAVVPAIVIK